MNKNKKSGWIKDRRIELGLNQDELTARLQTLGIDVTRATVSHWENGRYQPPMHDAEFRKSLAIALRMSIKAMLIQAGYEVADTTHSEAAERAAYIIDHLPPDQQQLAVQILEQFMKQGV